MSRPDAVLEVKNFTRHQHYKKRNPPWIKLYNELLDDYEFARLPDASKLHLVMIWLLASKYGNRVPADPQWIARRIGATEPVNLQVLLDAGFLILHAACQQDASTVHASRERSALPEGEGEGETEPERKSSEASPPARAAVENHNGDTTHTRNSVLGLVIEHLYFGTRPSEPDVARNASVLVRLHQAGRTWDEIARIVIGLAYLRNAGELSSVPRTNPISCLWLNDKDPVLNQLARCEDAFYRGPPAPPARPGARRRRATAPEALRDLLTIPTPDPARHGAA